MRSLIFVFLLAGCASDPVVVDDEVEVGAEDGGKADTDSEVRVRTGDTTLWVDKAIAVTDGALVLRGRTSRTITDGTAFVFDDPYGDFATRSARTFEVTWPVATARSLVDGVNQFVRLAFPHSAGRPDALTARVIVRPRLGGFTGSASVYVTAELTPVVVGGATVYRAHGHTTSANTAVGVIAGGVSLTDVHRVDDTQFTFDLAPDVALQQPDVAITARVASGTVTKRARLGFALKRLGLTAGDAYEKWPRPDCDDPTRTCLLGEPDGAVDLAACGEAVAVLSCAGKLGVFADDVAVQAALHDGSARTASAAFRSDAAGLVGAHRLDQLAGGTEQTIDDKVTRLFGRWYLSATARDAALTGAVDDAILAAYARPLDLVEPSVPKAGDAAATHQVAADALLAELAVHDFVATEFGRPYDDLVRDFRALHVQSIRELRETIAIEPYPGHPEWDVLIGSWLGQGPHVEVTIDKATGTAANVLIEID